MANYMRRALRALRNDVKEEGAVLSTHDALFAQQLDRIELDLEEIKELLHENIALTRIRRRKKGEPTDNETIDTLGSQIITSLSDAIHTGERGSGSGSDGYIKGHEVESITIDKAREVPVL